MFKKVLIAEDHESAGISVLKTLEELKITDTHFVYYCDDALQRAKKSAAEGEPFDLLITDLSFDEDHREQRIKNGAQLISEVRQILPSIKSIVFSIEKKATKIELLFKQYHIDGFVQKGRGDAQQMKKAILAVSDNKKFISPEHKLSLRKNTIELTAAELSILQLLSKGTVQKNIPLYLQDMGSKSCSLSYVEKNINNLKDTFQANNNAQLIAICKDLGIL
ncbi:MAG: response regulator [Weeksellaceae bacterium]|nr:response regulator [Bacteroidota bacterium]MCG2781848.1 response regulator [Weeksellaceae bacterium]